MTEDAYRNIFCTNLKRLMKDRGVTQMDLMQALNIPSATISTWVNGQRMPKMSKIQMLAEYFGVDPMDMIQEKQPLPGISEDEERLIGMYRRLSAYDKLMALNILKGMNNEH